MKKFLRALGRALPAILLVALLAFSVFRGCAKPPDANWIQLEYGIHYAPAPPDDAHGADMLSDGDAKTFYASGDAAGGGASNVLILDLGPSARSFGIARIDYTPRPDGGAGGRVLKYNIYFLKHANAGKGRQYVGSQLSLNADFELAGHGQLDPGSDATQSIYLHPYTGQLMAIQAAPSSTNGGGISAAEIAVYAVGEGPGTPDMDYSAHKEELTAIRRAAAEKELPALEKLAFEIDARVGSDTVAFNKNSKAEQERLLAQLRQLNASAQNVGALPSQPNGGIWIDTEGAAIQAHSGGIFYDEAEKRYYWYGADASQPNLLASERYQATGVRCYSSTDLLNWRPEGLALPVFNNPQLVDGSTSEDSTPLYVDEDSAAYKKSTLRVFVDTAVGGVHFPPNGTAKPPAATLTEACGAEGIAGLNALYEGYSYRQKQQLYKALNWEKTLLRPQVAYNAAAKQYVMWLLVEDYAARGAGGSAARFTLATAVSQSPAGPFRYMGGAPLRLEADQNYEPTDFSLFVDEDGSAWIAAALRVLPSETAEGEAGQETAAPALYVLRLNGSRNAPEVSAEGMPLEGEQWARVPGSEGKAAPVLLRGEEQYYLLANAGGGPSEGVCFAAKDVLGEWKAKGAFAAGDAAKNTWRSVPMAALPLRDGNGGIVRGKLYLLADVPDPYDARDASYAILPLYDGGGKLTLRWEADALPQRFGGLSTLAIALTCAGALLLALVVVLAAILLRKKKIRAVSALCLALALLCLASCAKRTKLYLPFGEDCAYAAGVYEEEEGTRNKNKIAVNTYGNMPYSALAVNRRAVQVGDTLFTAVNAAQSLQKIDANGKAVTLFDEDMVGQVGYYGGCLYFSNYVPILEPPVKGEFYASKLYRLNVGKGAAEPELLLEARIQKDYFASFQLCNGYLYLMGTKAYSTFGVKRLDLNAKTDGKTSPMLLSDTKVSGAQVSGAKVYYIVRGQLFEAALRGVERTSLLSTNDVRAFCVVEDTLYFIRTGEPGVFALALATGAVTAFREEGNVEAFFSLSGVGAPDCFVVAADGAKSTDPRQLIYQPPGSPAKILAEDVMALNLSYMQPFCEGGTICYFSFELSEDVKVKPNHGYINAIDVAAGTAETLYDWPIT